MARGKAALYLPSYFLSLEPLLCHIRANKILGLTVGTEPHKISGYTDDLLFMLSNPVLSLPVLMKEICEYGDLKQAELKRH